MPRFSAAALFGLILTCAASAGPSPAFAQSPDATPAQGAAAAEGGNGSMSQFTGVGGDPVLGEQIYQKRCASCHDNPSGRIPPKAAIAENTPTFIASALIEGVMRPMSIGLAPHEISSVATYLSTRRDGGLAGGEALEAPACTDKPAPFALGGSAWNGWGNGETQARFQPSPGLTAQEVPRLKLKWAFAYQGTRNGQATVVGGRLFLTSSSGAI